MTDWQAFSLGMGVGVIVWVVWTYGAARFVLWREHRGWEADDDPPPVTVTFNVDTTAFVAAMRNVSTAMANVTPLIAPGIIRAVADMERAMRKLSASINRTVAPLEGQLAQLAREREVKVAGLCARYQVRAGLDPACAGPDGLMLLLREIRYAHRPTGGAWRPKSVRLTEGELVEVQVAAIRGHAEAYDKDRRPCFASGRNYGPQRMLVDSLV